MYKWLLGRRGEEDRIGQVERLYCDEISVGASTGYYGELWSWKFLGLLPLRQGSHVFLLLHQVIDYRLLPGSRHKIRQNTFLQLRVVPRETKL